MAFDALFLACALALRPVSFPPIHDDPWFKEFAESFQMTYPNREIWFIKGYNLPEPEFERVPWVTYRGYTIYARRAA
jgi:hypothetical protein